MPDDDELARYRVLEAEYREARRLFASKMSEYYPERGRRAAEITDEEANAEIERYAARAYELEVALFGPRREPPAEP